MPQTKFVTAKALRLGLRPIVVLNKVDKPDAEPDRALNEVFDLFVALDADEVQLDFPVLYASGRSGWADAELDGPREGPRRALPADPRSRAAAGAGCVRAASRSRCSATTLAADPFLGRLLTGRIERGTVRTGQTVKAMSRDGREIERFRVSKVLAFRGLRAPPSTPPRPATSSASPGMAKATVADTLCDAGGDEAIPAQPIDPPTISVTFGINDSPLAGRDGDKVQSRVIRDRLLREAEIQRRDQGGGHAGRRRVRGLGSRRAADGRTDREHAPRGLRAQRVSRPQVLFREEGGQRLEPIEEVTVDVDEEYSRRGRRQAQPAQGRAGRDAHRGGRQDPDRRACAIRGLIGYHGEFLTDTRGTGVLEPRVPRLGALLAAPFPGGATAC